MSADHHPFAQVEAWLRDHRPTIIEKLEEAMSHLQDLIDNGKKLAAERAALITDRDDQKARADAAEAHVSDLQAQLDANDKLASDANDDMVAEIAKEAGVPSDGSAPAASAPLAPQADPSAPAAPVVTTVGTATVTVDPTAGATTHVDATGTTTTVPHDGSEPTATTSGGVPVTPDPAAVAAATDAAAQAGVTVAPAAPAAS